MGIIEDTLIRDPYDPFSTEWQRKILLLCQSSKMLDSSEQISLEGAFLQKKYGTFRYLESLKNKKYPFDPKNRNKYPGSWPTIRKRAIESAKGRCENCKVKNGTKNPRTRRRKVKNPRARRRIVLVVAHLDHNPQNCDESNLKVLCRSCHMVNDAPLRRYYWETRMNDWWLKEGRQAAMKLGLWKRTRKKRKVS